MIAIGKHKIRQIWLVDFEFKALPGERPEPICMVAMDYFSRKKIRLWESDFTTYNRPPFTCGNDSLFVAYYASAEIACYHSLNWACPKNVLDLYSEFRALTNGFKLPCGSGLLGALAYYGLSSIEAVEKNSMRELALRGGPWTGEEQRALLEYCETDVEALNRLLTVMLLKIDIPRAILRGRYMKAAAAIECHGIPIDKAALNKLRHNWELIQDTLVAEIDSDYGVYDGRTFKRERFERYLESTGIPWPRLTTGTLDLKDSTFRKMASAFPEIRPIRSLRSALAKMRLAKLTVGRDNRNQTLLSAFSSRTGRNQPSNSKFIFGQASWLRGLIQPETGYALAYIDWSQQEFGIAAALSGDSKMIEAYLSGDPYLEFAKQCGAIPQNATKESHSMERAVFKACVLAVQYGMGSKALAEKIQQPEYNARELLNLHRDTFSDFWIWSDGALDYAMLNNELCTVFGWKLHVRNEVNPRSLRNFPMQANGAEMLRLACCFGIEKGLRICAPVHDAILIEATEVRLMKQSSWPRMPWFRQVR